MKCSLGPEGEDPGPVHMHVNHGAITRLVHGCVGEPGRKSDFRIATELLTNVSAFLVR